MLREHCEYYKTLLNQNQYYQLLRINNLDAKLYLIFFASIIGYEISES